MRVPCWPTIFLALVAIVLFVYLKISTRKQGRYDLLPKGGADFGTLVFGVFYVIIFSVAAYVWFISEL